MQHTERSTIVDLLIKIPGPATYLKVHIFFQKVQNLSKRSKISNVSPWRFDKISLLLLTCYLLTARYLYHSHLINQSKANYHAATIRNKP